MAVMEAIATQYTEATVTSVEFTLPTSGYAHLQFRIAGQVDNGGFHEYFYMWLGASGSADTGANQYANGALRGYGTSETGYQGGWGSPRLYSPYIIGYGNDPLNLKYNNIGGKSGITIDVFDYANTNKQTSMIYTIAQPNYTGGISNIVLGGWSWKDTSTPNYARFATDTVAANGFTRGCSFSLYGLKSS